MIIIIISAIMLIWNCRAKIILVNKMMWFSIRSQSERKSHDDLFFDDLRPNLLELRWFVRVLRVLHCILWTCNNVRLAWWISSLDQSLVYFLCLLLQYWFFFLCYFKDFYQYLQHARGERCFSMSLWNHLSLIWKKISPERELVSHKQLVF